MFSVLLAATLSFTLPGHNDAGTADVRVCVAGPDTCVDLRSVSLFRMTQSATWAAKRDSMLADESAWSRYWPTVRDEAGPKMLLSRGVTRFAAGTSQSFDVPREAGCYFVTTRDAAGNASCWSNLVEW